MFLWIRKLILAFGLLFVGLVLFAYLSMRPPRFSVPAHHSIVLAGVELIEPGIGRSAAQSIVIDKGRIVEVRDAGADRGPYTGLYALPGLIDMQAQMAMLQEHAAILSLRYGVTAVRDPGAPPDSVKDYRGAWTQSQLPGPRLFACATPIEGRPRTSGLSLIVESEDDARTRVRSWSADGLDCVATYEMLAPEVLAAAREEAHAHDMRVSGRVPLAMRFEDAGLDDVQGLSGLPPIAVSKEALAQRRFTLNDWLAAWEKLDGERIAAYVHTSSVAGTAHIPMLVRWQALRQSRDFEAYSRLGQSQLYPRWVTEVIWSPVSRPPYLQMNEEGYRGLEAMLSRTSTVVGRLLRGGVPVMVGSGAPNGVVHGAAVHDELRSLVATGMSPELALASATTIPGRYLGLEGLGRLTAGAPADVILFRKDPTQDLANLSTLEVVIVDGRVYETSDLESMIGESLDHYNGRFVSRVWQMIAIRIVEAMNARVARDDPAQQNQDSAR